MSCRHLQYSFTLVIFNMNYKLYSFKRKLSFSIYLCEKDDFIPHGEVKQQALSEDYMTLYFADDHAYV